MEFDLVDNATQGTVIKVVGVGGAGGNAVQHMINKGVSGVEFIAANTDAQALATSSAHNLIQIAKKMGALTVAVVSKPFSYEGQKCMDIAEAGLDELAQHVDSLIIILNEK